MLSFNRPIVDRVSINLLQYVPYILEKTIIPDNKVNLLKNGV